MSPNQHKDSRIHRDDLEMWCQTAAHCGKFRHALKQIRDIEARGDRASAWWRRGSDVVVEHDLGQEPEKKLHKPDKPKSKPIGPVTSSQEAILKVLVGKMTTSEIAVLLAKPSAAVNSSLQSLRSAGRVIMETTESGLTWILN